MDELPTDGPGLLAYLKAAMPDLYADLMRLTPGEGFVCEKIGIAFQNGNPPESVIDALEKVAERLRTRAPDLGYYLAYLGRVRPTGDTAADRATAALLLRTARSVVELTERAAAALTGKADPDHVRWLAEYGLPVAAIAEKIGCSRPTVYKIMREPSVQRDRSKPPPPAT